MRIIGQMEKPRSKIAIQISMLYPLLLGQQSYLSIQNPFRTWAAAINGGGWWTSWRTIHSLKFWQIRIHIPYPQDGTGWHLDVSLVVLSQIRIKKTIVWSQLCSVATNGPCTSFPRMFHVAFEFSSINAPTLDVIVWAHINEYLVLYGIVLVAFYFGLRNLDALPTSRTHWIVLWSIKE